MCTAYGGYSQTGQPVTRLCREIHRLITTLLLVDETCCSDPAKWKLLLVLQCSSIGKIYIKKLSKKCGRCCKINIIICQITPLACNERPRNTQTDIKLSENVENSLYLG